MPEGRSGMVAFITEKLEPAYYGGSSWDDAGKHIHASGFVLRKGKWRSLESLKSPIAYAAVAGDGDILLAAGGTDGIDLRPKLITLTSSFQLSETEIPPSQTRMYSGAALIDQAFYIIGGSTQLSPLEPSAEISKFEDGVWSNVGQLPEGPLINSTVASWKDSLFVLGGGKPGSAGLVNSDSVYSFETTKNRWIRQTSLPVPTRGAVALSTADKGILIIGGYIDPPGSSSQVLLFDPEKNEFVSLTNLPIRLLLPAVVAKGNWIYVLGGEDVAQHRSNRVYRADLTALLKSREE
jgi:N-acetylneuraminic acid mutarotase